MRIDNFTYYKEINKLVSESIIPNLAQSPESFLWHFAWINSLTVPLASRLLRRIYVVASINPDLLTKNYPVAWINWLQSLIRGDILSENVISTALKDDRWLIFDTNWLRFCPVCMEAGFHTWFHQCRIHRYCLLHGCQLSERCIHCQRRIPLERSGASTFTWSYECRFCSKPVGGVETTREAIFDFISLVEVANSRYEPWYRWFVDLTKFLKSRRKIRNNSIGQIYPNGRFNSRASYELAGILSSCPPPQMHEGMTIPPITVRKVSAIKYNWLLDFPEETMTSYFPWKTLERFIDTMLEHFNEIEKAQFISFRSEIGKGLRILHEDLKPKALALTSLEAYVRGCIPINIDSNNPKYFIKLVSLILEPLENNLWVSEESLLDVLVCYFSELVTWIERQAPSRDFSLDIRHLFANPGVSGYLKLCSSVAGETEVNELLLIYPRLSWLHNPSCCLEPHTCERDGWDFSEHGFAIDPWILRSSWDCPLTSNRRSRQMDAMAMRRHANTGNQAWERFGH